jgi:hypothetical protein
VADGRFTKERGMDTSGYISAPIRCPSLHIFDVTQEAAAIHSDDRNVVLNRINTPIARSA